LPSCAPLVGNHRCARRLGRVCRAWRETFTWCLLSGGIWKQRPSADSLPVRTEVEMFPLWHYAPGSSMPVLPIVGSTLGIGYPVENDGVWTLCPDEAKDESPMLSATWDRVERAGRHWRLVPHGRMSEDCSSMERWKGESQPNLSGRIDLPRRHREEVTLCRPLLNRGSGKSLVRSLDRALGSGLRYGRGAGHGRGRSRHLLRQC
jgi:hypothetical protein